MTNPYRKPPFAFAEIMITAPWVHTLIAKDRDNDMGEMLQCNIAGDERSPQNGAIDGAVLEREARIARAAYLRAQIKRATRALRELIRRSSALRAAGLIRPRGGPSGSSRGRAGRPQPQH
jgi:hypothetical protein